jgi:hypothetical protein
VLVSEEGLVRGLDRDDLVLLDRIDVAYEYSAEIGFTSKYGLVQLMSAF